jgi:hypothetical protein
MVEEISVIFGESLINKPNDDYSFKAHRSARGEGKGA